MKQKRKHLLKKFLIFGIAFLLASCSEELYDEAIGSSNKKTIKEIKFNELYKDIKFKNLLEKVSHTSNAARTSFENQNGFTISDGFVKVIETDSVVSYTMLIERDIVTDTISFENLVIQENSLGVQKAKILKYTPTTITLSGHDSFYFDGSIIKKNIAFTGFNKNTSNNTTLAECYTYIFQVWCSEPYENQTTHHIAGSKCSPNTTYIKAVKVLSPDDCGSTGGSGSDDSFGDPYSNPGGGGGVTGNTENTPEEDVITSPVKPGLDGGTPGKTPCTELTKLTVNVANKEAIENLQTKTSEDKENGFSISKNSTGGYATPVACNSNINNPDEIVMPTGGNIIGAFHTHPDASTTDIFPMFSDGDLNWLFWVTTNHNTNGADKDYSEYFLTLTVPQGTFAIKIKDISKFNTFRSSKEWKNFNNGQKGELKTLRKKYDALESTSNFNSITNAFLEVLRDSNSGIGLYEASSDLSSWSELTLAPNSATNATTPPIKKPCIN
jgi:hypothetical protein